MTRLAWLTAKARPDGDGEHFWLTHECVEGPTETMLPNIWRAGTTGLLTPSVMCRACGMHTFVPIESD